MKKLFYSLIIFLNISILQAQDFVPEWQFGTTQGVTLSQISFVPNVSQDFLVGYNGGIVARYISESNLGLQAELNYSQRGWQEKDDATGNSLHRFLNYIELPVLTHIYFGKKTFRGFFNLGPKLAYCVGSSNSLGDPVSPVPDRLTMDVEHRFDYALAIGFGFGFKLGRFFYQAEARYGFGLGDVFKSGKADTYQRSAHRDLAINLSMLYRL